jgi:hypothetical protein
MTDTQLFTKYILYINEQKEMICLLYVIQLSDRVYNVTFPAYALYSLRRIQLSDRVYNVTFPAYDLYSLRRSRREYRA